MSGWIHVSNSTDHSLPPLKRAWLRFRANRLGFYSAVLFAAMFFFSLFAEVISNDKPLLAGYQGNWYVPIIQTIPETAFGGDFDTPTDFLDPFIQAEFDKKGTGRSIRSTLTTTAR